MCAILFRVMHGIFYILKGNIKKHLQDLLIRIEYILGYKY